jgi:hypothetical protein
VVKEGIERRAVNYVTNSRLALSKSIPKPFYKQYTGIFKQYWGVLKIDTEIVKLFLWDLLMKSYRLSDISPSRTHNRSDRSPGYRLCFVTEQYVPRIGYLKERVSVRVSTYTCNDTCIALSGHVQRHL